MPSPATVLTTELEVRRLAPLWAELAIGHPAATPFNSPGWALSWWDAWWRQPSPGALAWRCVTMRDSAGRLGGVLPLARFPDGVTRYAAPDLIDLAAALVDNDRLREFWWTAADVLRQHDGPGLLAVPTVAERDRAAIVQVGLRVHVDEIEPCALIELPESWDRYWSRLPAGRRRLWRSERRRLASENGPVTFDVGVNRAALPRLVTDFWRLREESWRRRGRYAQLAPRTAGASLRWFLDSVADPSALGLRPAVARMRAGGRVVAMSLMFFSGERVWYYMSAYDADFARYGVGRMLLTDCIRYAVEQLDATTFDLGRGIEPYKFTVGARRYELARIAISL